MQAIAPLQLELNRQTRTAFMSLDKLPVCRLGEVFAPDSRGEDDPPEYVIISSIRRGPGPEIPRVEIK